MNPTVAAARPRVLSTSTLIADWCTPRPRLTDMQVQSAVVPVNAHDNSITRTAPVVGLPTVVPTALAGGFGYGAAKQAAPPRGVPR
jgi:hypothetical protein